MPTINEIKERESKATKGPWTWDTHIDVCGNGAKKKIARLRSETEFYERRFNFDVKKVIIDQESWYVLPEEKDSEFIAHSREDIPYLLKKIEKIQTILEQGNHCHSCDLFDAINHIILE